MLNVGATTFANSLLCCSARVFVCMSVSWCTKFEWYSMYLFILRSWLIGYTYLFRTVREWRWGYVCVRNSVFTAHWTVWMNFSPFVACGICWVFFYYYFEFVCLNFGSVAWTAFETNVVRLHKMVIFSVFTVQPMVIFDKFCCFRHSSHSCDGRKLIQCTGMKCWSVVCTQIKEPKMIYTHTDLINEWTTINDENILIDAKQ